MPHQDTGESALYRQTRKKILAKKICFKRGNTTKGNFPNLGTRRICGTIDAESNSHSTNASQPVCGFISHLHQAIQNPGTLRKGQTKDKCASWKPNKVMATRHQSSHYLHEQTII
jgi:hypothetical protein